MATDTLVSERERLYKASAGKPEIVLVPEMSFVMIDGHGDPNSSQDYKDAIEALYPLSYTLKFALKKEQGLQYRVGPLEGCGGLRTWLRSTSSARATGTGP